MKNSKINRNKPQPSSSEINARKDFDSILSKHKASSSSSVLKNIFKSGKLNAVIISLAVLSIAAVVYFVKNNGKQNLDKQQVATTDSVGMDKTFLPTRNSDMIQSAYIHKPFKDVDVPFENFKVQVGKETILTHSSGSKIKIPKNAFVDENGKALVGEVDVHYRELHDPVDFFVSGIPMTYDSAGTQRHFESAGMLEIYAFKNGKVVKMSSDKLIEVQMISNDKSTKYNLYQLDTTARQWDYKGKDKVNDMKNEPSVVALNQTKPDTTKFISVANDSKVIQISEKINIVKTEIQQINTKKPDEPKKASKERFQFNLEVDAKEFPELAVYKGALFEVGAENKDFTDRFYKVTWDNAVLAEGKKGINYTLTLTKDKETRQLSVYPVYDGKNYEKAKADYQQKFDQYSLKLEDRKAEEKKLGIEYAARVKEIQAQRKAQEEKWEKDNKDRMAVMNTTQKVMRVFTIDGFGIWNCDCPHALPKGNELAARFSDQNQQPLNFDYVYLVEQDKNALFTYYSYKFNSFTYNPDSKNMMWAVTRDNKLAVFHYGDFENIPRKKGAYNFVMTTVNKEFKSVKEIKEYLDI